MWLALRVFFIANAILMHNAHTGKHNGISATITSERNSIVTFENLSPRKWNIGPETAKWTLQVTTQRGVRTVVHPLHPQYCVDQLHLNRRRLNGDWLVHRCFIFEGYTYQTSKATFLNLNNIYKHLFQYDKKQFSYTWAIHVVHLVEKTRIFSETWVLGHIFLKS